MNILIVNTAKEPGYYNTFFKHISYWQKNGHNVYLLTTNSGLPGLPKSETIKNPLILRLKLLTIFLSPFRKEYDLVVENWAKLPFFTPIFTKTTKLIFVPEAINPKTAKYLLLKRIYKHSYFLVRREEVKNNLQSIGVKATNIKVIRDGVDFKNESAKAKKEIITAVGIETITDAKKAIDTFEFVERRNVDWKYCLLVNTKLVSVVRKMLKSTSVSAKTTVISNSREKTAKTINNSGFLLMIGKSSGWFSIAVDAFSHGVLLLVSLNTPAAKLVKQTEAGVVVEKSALAFANKILELIIDTKKYDKLTSNSKKHAQKYSWEAVTAQSLEYIESI